MAKKLAAVLGAAVALALPLAAPAGSAEGHRPPAHDKPRIVIEPVATPLRWLDISFGEVDEGLWKRVTSVSYQVIGCEPGESLYWSGGPAYQDGRMLSGVFEGLGQGEATCEADGTSTYGDRWYREPRSLHPGWMRYTVTLHDQLTGEHLGTGTRWVWIPYAHPRGHSMPAHAVRSH